MDEIGANAFGADRTAQLAAGKCRRLPRGELRLEVARPGVSLDAKTKQLLERALAKVDEHETRGPRLLSDAHRLWCRAQAFLDMKLLPESIDPAPLELACYALQLPVRQLKLLPTGKLGRTNLKDRAEQAAEMLVGLVADQVDAALLDRATQILHELPLRSPTLDEARLLADAVNLDDFGVTGILVQTIHLSRAGGGAAQLADGLEKREQYGYWDARLKEGFHFEPVRQIARRRLEHTRRAMSLLLEEMKEDRVL
jgi:hypothetical protein